MHERDVEVGIFLRDELAIGRAGLVDRRIRHRLERGLERGEALARRARARIFLAVERKRAVLVVHRHEALGEVAVADRVVGALLAHQREIVERLARNVLQRRDRVRADALMRLRMARAQTQVSAVHHGRPSVRAAPARHRHHLGAARDHQVLEARHDRGGRDVHRGDAGAAETVQRHAARLHRIARIERRHAAEVAALRADLRGGAPDDVVDVGGVDAGALGERLQHGRGELLRMDLRQRALLVLADAARRAAGVDDPGFRHGGIPGSRAFRTISSRPCVRFNAGVRRALLRGDAFPDQCRWPETSRISSSNRVDA